AGHWKRLYRLWARQYPAEKVVTGQELAAGSLRHLGPILDRIDLQVELKPLTVDERFAASEEGVSSRMRAQVERARDRQDQRYEGTQIPFNAAMPGGHIGDYCQFSAAGLETFRGVVASRTLSTRSMDRLAKVARTIADLGESAAVEPPHVQEATTFVIGGVLRDSS
ncbi:MAG: hypothetical protein ACK5BP_12400, partial [Planctomyces sp.]